MADITITAANVLVGGLGTTKEAGVDITAGQLVYIDTAASNVVKLALVSAAASAVVYGMALNDAVAGQPVAILTSGSVDVGAVLGDVGHVFCLGGVAGKMADIADLAASDYVSIIGYATDSNTLVLSIVNSGLVYA